MPEMEQQEKWILCPVCGNKTRNKIRADTVLKYFPLFCPKRKKESLIEVEELKIKAAPHNLARAFGQRFCLIRKL